MATGAVSIASLRCRLAGIATATAMAVLAGCGAGDEGDSFSSGRACRNVERLIEAVQAGDQSTAAQELERLTDDDDVEQQLDVAELEDVVDDPDSDAGDAIEDAVSGLDCDLDIEVVDTTDPTTIPTMTDPTEPTVTDPTTDPTGQPPFTLPPAPTTATVPATDPTTTGPPATTATSATTPTTSSSSDPQRRVPLIAVDVGAVGSDDVGEYDPRDLQELAALFGLEGLMVPAGPSEVDLVYVAHEFGDSRSRYDNFGFRFASELSEREVLARFREAVSQQGDYTFGQSDIADDIGFDTTSVDFEAQIPNWDVRVSPKEGQVHRLEIVRSDYSDNVRTQMRDIITEERQVEIGVLDELGWDVSGFSYYSSTDASSSVYKTSSLTFVTSDALVDAKDRLVSTLGRGAEATEEDDSFSIETANGFWRLADYGAGVTGRFTSQ